MPSSGTPRTDAIEAFRRFLEKTRIVEAIDYGGETACFVASKMGKTDLPGIET
jgi:hypothetical protein